MSMRFHIFQSCSQKGPFKEISVHSESSENVYAVLITDQKDPKEAVCDCRGFRYSKTGTCKHQENAIQSQCNWDSEHGVPQSLMERIGMTCPECGSSTEWNMKNDPN